MRAFGAVDREEALDLAEDQVERPRLVAVRRLDRVAVHRVAGPDDVRPSRFDGADQRRQLLGDLVGAEAARSASAGPARSPG